MERQSSEGAGTAEALELYFAGTRPDWYGVSEIHLVENPVMIDNITRTVITFKQESNGVVNLNRHVK